MFIRDVKPDFRFFSHSYLGDKSKEFAFESDHHVDLNPTSGYGHTLVQLCKFVTEHLQDVEMITIANGDVVYKFSEVNAMFHYADRLSLNWFQPALSRDSYHSHKFTLVRPGRLSHPADYFCECIFFTVPRSIIEFIAKSELMTESGFGMDCYLIPYAFEKIKPKGVNIPMVIDLCPVGHLKPLGPHGTKVYASGLTAMEELVQMQHAIARLRNP